MMKTPSPLRIVGIGGGTGLPVLLAGLSGCPGVNISGIVSVADNGGSSGRLRDDFNMPAVGDLRNCLVALSGSDSALASLFQHRFSQGGLEGHALGNLIVTALYQQTGSLVRAIEVASRMLCLEGRAIASTEVSATLCAALRDGTIVRGESEIAQTAGAIDRVWLEPDSPPPSPGVLEAIRSADAIVLAPGSLYTSLLPNLLVDGVVSAIQRSNAVRILVCNIATQPGETDGFSASDHLREVRSYLDGALIHYCVVNSETPDRCLKTGSQFVRQDLAEVAALGAIPVSGKLLSEEALEARHSADKLGRRVLSIAREWIGSAANESVVTPMKEQRIYPIQAAA
jgi:uncharacterized cofD-like protein